MTREMALKALDRRAYPRAELGDHLVRRGAERRTVEQVLDRLEEVGLINDADFADQWVGSRHRSRQLSRKALVLELRRKGLAEEVIENATAPIDREAEWQAARELADRKARSLASQPYEVALRRLVGTLGRRGFNGEIAWSVAKQALAGRDEPVHFDEWDVVTGRDP